MEKSIINIQCSLELVSEGQTKEEIINSIRIVSNNPDVVISKKIKEEIKISNQESNLKNIDPIYVDYFRFYKKN